MGIRQNGAGRLGCVALYVCLAVNAEVAETQRARRKTDIGLWGGRKAIAAKYAKGAKKLLCL